MSDEEDEEEEEDIRKESSDNARMDDENPSFASLFSARKFVVNKRARESQEEVEFSPVRSLRDRAMTTAAAVKSTSQAPNDTKRIGFVLPSTSNTQVKHKHPSPTLGAKNTTVSLAKTSPQDTSKLRKESLSFIEQIRDDAVEEDFRSLKETIHQTSDEEEEIHYEVNIDHTIEHFETEQRRHRSL